MFDGHDLVISAGDCTFHARCLCGRDLLPHHIRPDQSLDIFQRDWERHLMTEVDLDC